MKWNGAWRLLTGIALVLVLGGPAPGSVGSCDEENPFVDAVEWCVEKNGWLCQRRWARGELDDAERDMCLTQVQPMCQGATWGADCPMPPAKIQTNACVAALASVERLDEPADSIVECQLSTLCGGGS